MEEKLGYIKSLPKEKEEKLTRLVEKLTQKEEHQVLPPKTTWKPAKSNVFKSLEKSTTNCIFSMLEAY